MIPSDTKNVNNFSTFAPKIKFGIPNSCPCKLCRANICQGGYINCCLELMILIFQFYFQKLHISINMFMNGIKVCFVAYLYITA